MQSGIKGFYRGIDANIMRAMVLNGTKMACYDQIKGIITKSGYVPSGELRSYSGYVFHCICP
jgi:hypothetical protein